MALGADRGNVVELVLRGAFRRVVVGLVLGLPLAVAAGRLISAQLYGVPFWDPLALAVAAVSLAICAFFAAIIPARRAASISPMKALRANVNSSGARGAKGARAPRVGSCCPAVRLS